MVRRHWLWSLVLGAAAFHVNAQSLTPEERAPEVGILVFSAYGCGYCAQTAEIIETLRRRYPQRVAIQIKHYPLRDAADERWAHRAAFALGAQQRLAPLHSALFQVVSGTLGHDALRERAAEQGVNLSLFDRALASADSDLAIDNDRFEAIALGVHVTPTVFIDGFKLEGLQKIDVYDELIRFRLDQSGQPSKSESEVAAAESAQGEGRTK
jgi:protein-disulfide isomerase